jgi:uncharacterized membrane protein
MRLTENLRATAGSTPIAYGVVLWSMAIYTTSCFSLGLQRYEIFRAGVDDGIFMQVLNSALTGFHATAEGNYNHLSVHFSPILFLIAPIVQASHSAVSLIAIQAIAGASIALPLFLIGKKRMPPFFAAACASIGLLYPPLSSIMTGDFHEHAFTPAAIAWTLWAVDTGRFRPTLLCGMTALCVKEDVSVVFIVDGVLAGLWFHYKKDYVRAKLSFTLAVAGAVTILSFFKLLIPALHVPFAYWSFHFYTHLAAASPAGFVEPGDPIRAQYALNAFAPLCFLPLLSVAVVLCLPGFVEVLASREAITMTPGTHYAAVWVPFMLLAFVLLIGRAAARSQRLALWLLLAAGLVSRHMLLVDDPFARWYYIPRNVDQDDRTLQTFLDSLPPDDDISVLYDVYAHLGTDPNATIFPNLAKYILRDNLHETAGDKEQQKQVANLLKSGTYHRVASPPGIVLIERR